MLPQQTTARDPAGLDRRDVVSAAVETITGTPAQELKSFLKANPTLGKQLAG